METVTYMKILLNCPFCGGKAMLIQCWKSCGYIVQCGSGWSICSMVVKTKEHSKKIDAINQWNHRQIDEK